MVRISFFSTLLCLLLAPPLLFAQTVPPEELGEETDPYTSIRHEQADFFDQFEDYEHITTDEFGEPKRDLYKAKSRQPQCQLTKQVYGYHANWMDKYYKSYDYSLLSTFCYFGYKLNPLTGGYKSIYKWKTHKSIDLAKKAGCKVELCVMNFGHKNNTRFLNNRKAWKRLTNNLIKLLDYRNADGINIDFEGVPRDQGKNLTDFMIYLSKRLKTERCTPTATSVTMAIPAVDWYRIFDLKKLSKYVDSFIVMGYDYHFRGERRAGPVAPISHDYKSAWYNISLKKSINDYLRTGVEPYKLIVALPYYGYEWKTETVKIPSNRRKRTKGKAKVYSKIRRDYVGRFTQRYHRESASPYFITGSDQRPKQCWYDDERSLAKKYDLVKERDLGGVGMWALGYDNGYTELWDLLENKFMTCEQNKPITFNVATAVEPPPNMICRPVTMIEPLEKVYRYDFKVSFLDRDNCEGGWSGNFFQILENDGTEWRANYHKGFFNDEFTGVAIHRDWKTINGDWMVRENQLHQLNTNSPNTNIYIPLQQHGDFAYLYHWWAKMDGAGDNRRSGIHFFSDNPTAENRGNSYFVYFRIDNSRVEIYKVNNDQFERKAHAEAKLEPNQEYDYKITFNPSNGLIEAYVDNKLVVQWRDQQPHISGQFISLRTGNCQAAYDFVKVYRSRKATETIQLGLSENADVRFKSPSPYQPSCRIISIAKNKYQQWTAPDTKETAIE